MDDLIEIIIELIFEGSIKLLHDKKVPKWIRGIIALFLVGVQIGIIVLGVILFEKSILGGSIIISVGILLMIGIIIKIKKYMKK